MRRISAQGPGLFAIYAVASVAAFAALGIVSARIIEHEGDQHALTAAAEQAHTIARGVVETQLGFTQPSHGISTTERLRLSGPLGSMLRTGIAARLRIRAVNGSIVFDAAHPLDPTGPPSGDADIAEAAQGRTVRDLTRLDSDTSDGSKSSGARMLEVYAPLRSPRDASVIGILEVYVPYEPFAAAESASDRRLFTVLVGSLMGLWVLLAALTWAVTRRVRRNSELNEWLARHDQLTGLPNRGEFHDQVERATRGDLDSASVVLLDLDGFTQINDTLGHRNGDEFLRHIGEVLAERVGHEGVVARTGGDQFGVLMPGRVVDDAEIAELRRAMSAEIDLAGVPVGAEATAGVASWPLDGDDAESVVRAAELALHAAGEARSPVGRFHSGLDRFDPARLSLVAELRRALLNGELQLHYQPKISLADGRVESVEALVRWNHPSRGLVPPADFVPIAESTGLIAPLTSWVIDTALAQVGEWTDVGLPLSVAVNVSPRSLRDDLLPDEVARALDRRGVAPARLEIEITETSVLADPARAAGILGRLRESGVRISLDDFGQGATSLVHLGRLQLDELKVDRAFVDGMVTSREDLMIVRAVIELGHHLGLTVVAEGVETDDQLAMLAELGCDVAQGYLFSRPVPADDLVAWLRARSAQRVSRTVVG